MSSRRIPNTHSGFFVSTLCAVLVNCGQTTSMRDVVDPVDGANDTAADAVDATSDLRDAPIADSTDDIGDASDTADAEVAPDTSCPPATPLRCGDVCVDSATDPAHCGGCETTCANPSNGIGTCVAGSCGFRCDPDFHECGGSCVSNFDPATCGASCAPCIAPDHGIATCSGTTCGIACAAGYVALGGTSCVIAAPRPIAPLSTGSVTRRRPTLRWELAGGADGAHVEICSDRACTARIAEFDATGTSAAAPVDLPVGNVFWRLRGIAGGTTGTLESATWQFHVGALSAPTDSSSGTTLDVNGDGYADVLVGARGGIAFLYLGSAAGLGTTPMQLPGPEGGDFGVALASAADVNGDGYGDLVIGSTEAAGFRGSTYVYFGSATGVAASPNITIDGPDGGGFGSAVASAGDVNGDGYGDLVVGAQYAISGEGRAYVLFGSSSGPALTPDVAFPSPDGGNFGHGVASAGDVNADGFADILIGGMGSPGRAYVYLGRATGPRSGPDARLLFSGSFSLGGSVAGAGDVNGDGYSDVLVGDPQGHSRLGDVYVFYGQSTGISLTPAATLTGLDTLGWFGSSVAFAGDVNGDGYADIVGGAPFANSSTGSVNVYFGGATGVPSTPSLVLASPAGTNGTFGDTVACAGDTNGDGYTDVIVGATGAAGRVGRVYAYRADTTGLPAMPTETLAPPPVPGASISAFGEWIE